MGKGMLSSSGAITHGSQAKVIGPAQDEMN